MQYVRNGIAELIKEFRQALCQTQQQFAQTMGVTITTVARWETQRPPKGKWLAQLALEAERRGWTDIGQRFKRLLSAELFNDSSTAQPASHQQALESPDANPWLEALTYLLESPFDSETQPLLLDILQTYQYKLARTGQQRDPVHWNRLRRMFRLLDLQNSPTKTEGSESDAAHSIAEPMGRHRANEDPSNKKPEPRFHCPTCGAPAGNRQGLVSHLRQIHGLDKAARDLLLDSSPAAGQSAPEPVGVPAAPDHNGE